MRRFELLCSLFKAGINPFTIYRADARPKPMRFPVFVRGENDHNGPLSDLLGSQTELDGYLGRLRGRRLKGLIVVEQASEPIAPDLWLKVGTFKVGKNCFTHSAIMADRWAVKDRMPELAIDRAPERAAFFSETVAEPVRRAFEIAAIEWGRADHATYKGRQIVFEINTNPHFYGLVPRRHETTKLALERMSKLLWEIDGGDGAPVRFASSVSLRQRLRRFASSAQSAMFSRH
jgi:hypothetical protein